VCRGEFRRRSRRGRPSVRAFEAEADDGQAVPDNCEGETDQRRR
jgi:hypothetical protein